MFAKTNLPNLCSPSLPIIASNQYNGLYVPMFVFNLPRRRGFGAAAGAACVAKFYRMFTRFCRIFAPNLAGISVNFTELHEIYKCP